MLPKRHHGYFVPGTCNEYHLGPKQRDNGETITKTTKQAASVRPATTRACETESSPQPLNPEELVPPVSQIVHSRS